MTGPSLRMWTGAGNDYRGIERLDPGPSPSLAIVVTGSRTDWDTTLRALAAQRYDGPLEIVCATDGPLPGAAGDWPVTTSTPSTPLVEAVGDSEVVLLLSEGQVPEPDWVERHADWHRKAQNVVVLGDNTEDDSSSRAIRRTRQLLSSDEVFTSMRASNVSLRRELWAQHAKLDVTAGWHLWNDGLFFVFEPEARISTSGSATDHPVNDNDPLLLEDRIPHRRYRPVPSALHNTPKVSWIVAVASHEEALSAWNTCQQSSFPDYEVVFHGAAEAVAGFQELAQVNSRVSVVDDDGTGAFQAAVATSRGELIAILDPRATVSPETLPKAVARFEANPSAPVVRVGYGIDGDRYLRLDDLAAIDGELGLHGMPLFAAVTRRELMKDPSQMADAGVGWQRVLDRNTPSLVVSPLIELEASTSVKPRMAGLTELPAIGIREIAREVVREARRRRAGTVATKDRAKPDAPGDPLKVSVAYVGFTGHDNLGDEAVKVAIERLMPWAEFEAEPADPKLLMVGGGTLINGRRYYLTRLLRQESATVERALFGTGVRSPEYWGETEPMDDWFSFIDSAVVAAVRGPDSVKNLRKLGYHRDLPVIGDPALYLRPPADAARVDGRIVVCPVYTSGNLHGGSDDTVFDALADLISKMRSEGRDVVMLSAFPQDDRWVIDIMRRAKAPDLPYLAGYADIDDTMGLLASADLVVGERLHASIMAAAAGTPFVGLEYRPKVRDFGRSVGQEKAVIRTDEMHLLDAVCARVLSEHDQIVAEIASHVSEYRGMQEAAADDLRRRFLDD